MTKRNLVGTVLALALAGLAAISCSSPAPAPKASPSPSPAPAPKTTAAPAPSPSAAPKPAAAPVRLAVGATTSTSASYVYSVAAAKAIKQYAPGLDVTLMETGGGEDAYARLNRGEIHVGMFDTSTLSDIYNGLGRPKNADVRGLVPLKPTLFHFIVRADSNINTFEDLTGKTYNAGSKGTGSEPRIVRILGAMNVKPDLYSATYAEAADRFKARAIVGLTLQGAPPDSNVLEIQATTPIKILGFSEENWKRVEAGVAGSPRAIIPARSYSGQDKDIVTTGIVAALETTKSAISEDTAYQFAKAFCQGYTQFMAPLHKSMADIKSPEDWLIDSYKSPLHAGVVKYLREKGKTVPPALIPPEVK